MVKPLCTVGKKIRDLGIIHSILDGFGLYLHEPSSDCYRGHLTKFKHNFANVAKNPMFQSETLGSLVPIDSRCSLKISFRKMFMAL